MIVTDLEYLRKPCKEVEDQHNVEAMAYALRWELKKYPGCSMAANQAHISYRVCVIAQGTMMPIVLVNPVIVKQQKPRLVAEGCLSLPGITVSVARFMYVKVKGMDEKRRKVKYTFTGTQAQAVQHEIDHLDGKLMIDYLSPADRQKAEDYLRKEALKGEKQAEGQQYTAQEETDRAQQEEAGPQGKARNDVEINTDRTEEPGSPESEM